MFAQTAIWHHLAISYVKDLNIICFWLFGFPGRSRGCIHKTLHWLSFAHPFILRPKLVPSAVANVYIPEVHPHLSQGKL